MGDVAVGAEAHGLADVVFVLMHAQDDNFQLRPVFLGLLDNGQAAGAGHGNVQQHDVNRFMADLLQRLFTAGGFGRHGEIGISLQEQAQALAYE